MEERGGGVRKWIWTFVGAGIAQVLFAPVFGGYPWTLPAWMSLFAIFAAAVMALLNYAGAASGNSRISWLFFGYFLVLMFVHVGVLAWR